MSFPRDQKPWSFYRLGPTKEKELFKRGHDTYDGIVIPAHIASYYSAFCSEFIGSLRKPYFIDPMTYIFANDPSMLKRFIKDKKTKRTLRNRFGQKQKGDIKRSFLKLVEKEYGGLIKKAVLNDCSIKPEDFKDESLVNDFVPYGSPLRKTRVAPQLEGPASSLKSRTKGCFSRRV